MTKLTDWYKRDKGEVPPSIAVTSGEMLLMCSQGLNQEQIWNAWNIHLPGWTNNML